MKKYFIFAVVMLFFISTCSTKDNGTLQSVSDPAVQDDNANADSGSSQGTTEESITQDLVTVMEQNPALDPDLGSPIDYTVYENTDVETAYKDYNSVPAEIKTDASTGALVLVQAMEKMKGYSPSSKGLYSTIKSGVCLMTNCWKPMVSCVMNGECRSELMGLGTCTKKSGDEMMLCFITAFSDPCDKMLDMLNCWGEANCMTPPVPDCPLPTNRSQIAPVTLADLEGDWYVVRGLSTVYDCWNCQKYTFHQTSATTSTYDYTYFPAGNKATIKCTTTAIPFAPGETAIYPGRFRVDYMAYGMPGADDWFVLSRPNSNYVLIYYCGASMMDSYTGAIILSRNLDTNIPQNILDEFAAALANAGISVPVTMADLCTPVNSGCVY
jgi:hypothetical protein